MSIYSIGLPKIGSCEICGKKNVSLAFVDKGTKQKFGRCCLDEMLTVECSIDSCARKTGVCNPETIHLGT